ncbi:MAG TPA: ribonuclease III domain-containing protein [Solirubrobacterales bacterium]|nr:ribonuclease III domain-containing protein [Solirubrobacterales bacterium]
MGAETSLAGMIEALPDDLRTQALTHSSWAEERAESYGRLAFLGDSVLGLAVAEELYRRFPNSDIGRLTKVHGQAVSGRACAEIADELGVPAMLDAAAPQAGDAGIDVAALLDSERAMASIAEALIGACYLEHGYERTAAATVAAFDSEIELASETLLDFKSALQEELARSGSTVSYAVVNETGPAHERSFEVEATVRGEVLGVGSGRSKKSAEQAAARQALERVTD